MSKSARHRVLDTTVVSALMRGDPPAVEKLELCGRLNISIPQPVVAEIRYGLSRLPKSARRSRLEVRFDRIAQEIQRAPWTDEVSAMFGRLKAELERRGSMIEDFDLAIAAHALAERAVLATSNIRHMSRVPFLELEDWMA